MKTNKADFDLFEEQCWKWINTFSLNHIEFFFVHEDIGEDANATYDIGYSGMNCVIALGTEICMTGVNDKTKFIKRIAFHEIAEILISPLRAIAISRNFSEEELEAETHSIIHRLQRVLL